MTLTLFHHPFSRASTTIWALEELGEPYELRFIDVLGGEQKKPELLSLNPMGKLPTLVDEDVVITEAAAIALYLADRYALGRLAPPPDAPQRGPYLRWSFFAPSVLEPSVTCRANDWSFKASSVGWGSYEATIAAMKSALAGGFILGETFSMADVVLGGTIRTLMQFDLLDKDPVFTGYADRLAERPALQRADARNAAIAQAHGLGEG